MYGKGKAKIELAVAKGKNFDKRQTKQEIGIVTKQDILENKLVLAT